MSAQPTGGGKKSGFKRKSLIAGRYLGKHGASGTHHDVSVLSKRYVAVIGRGLSRAGFFERQKIDILRPEDEKGSIRIVGRFTIGGLHECSKDAPEELRQRVLSDLRLKLGIAESAKKIRHFRLMIGA